MLRIFQFIISLIFVFAPLHAQHTDADTLCDGSTELEERVQMLRKQIHVAESEIAELEKERYKSFPSEGFLRGRIASLSPFEGEKERMRALACESYLLLPLSQLSSDSLAWMCHALQAYAEEADVKPIWQRLMHVHAYKSTYDSCRMLLRLPLIPEELNKARKWCAMMKNAPDCSDAQWEEIDMLDIYLSVYPTGLDYFVNLIHDVEKRLEPFREQAVTDESSTEALAIVEECIGAHAEELELRASCVPYLQERYTRYTEMLREAPLTESPERLALQEDILNAPQRAQSCTRQLLPLYISIDSLQRVSESLQRKLESLRGESQEEVTLRLQGEVSDLEAAKSFFLLREIESRRSMLDSPFSKLSADTLQWVMTRLKPYSAVEEVGNFIEQLHDLALQKSGADEIAQAVHTPYNMNRVARARTLMRGLGHMSADQQKEMEAIRLGLDNYPSALAAFRDIIAKVDDKLAVFRSNYENGRANPQVMNMSKSFVKKLFAEREEDIKLIASVPFLQERFVRFREAMEKNPLKPSGEIIEDIIE